MAITQVRVQINGSWYVLSPTETPGQYSAQVTAPGTTSYNEPGGYYNVKAEATNDAGTVGQADAGTVEGLKFYVRETVAPTITVVSPTTGATVTNNKQPVVFNITDQASGSGVKLSSVVVKLDGTPVSSGEVTHSAGLESTVTRNVTLDTSVPQIISATIVPNPADTGETVIITVTVQ